MLPFLIGLNAIDSGDKVAAIMKAFKETILWKVILEVFTLRCQIEAGVIALDLPACCFREAARAKEM
jgi:hypothetical protein